MIPKECKRLAEVDFPIAVVSKHSAREKSIRHAHPSTLHLWWARRPLAACRALLLALLLPDPCDESCPEAFKKRLRNILSRVQGNCGSTDLDTRNELLRFIGHFSSWDNSATPALIEAARALVRAAHPEAPLVVDPFAGGGSIPLEALRTGCDAFASDLNPVASIILKTLLEDIPRHGVELADELRRIGSEVRKTAAKELAALYPSDAKNSSPIAYLWSRTVTCDTCGADIPLVRSFWLSTKSNRKRAIRFEVVRKHGTPPYLSFHVFEPRSDVDVPNGTVTRVKATCLCCRMVLSPERVRVQLASQSGGANPTFDTAGKRTGGALLLAVVTLNDATAGRQYRAALPKDYQAVFEAKKRLTQLEDAQASPAIPMIPDEEIPRTELRRISLPIYGVNRFRDMFNYRQLTITH